MKNSTRIQNAVALFVIITLLTFPTFTFAQSAKIRLEEGTQVRLKLMEAISSGTAQNGQVVSFEVLDEIRVNDQVVIAEGATAWGTIIDAEENKRFGRAGKLAIRIDYVKATDGSKIPLRANAEKRGAGKGVSTGVAVAVTALVFWPAAPLFMLRKGKNAEIPRGFHLQAFVDGDRMIAVREAGETFQTPATPTNNMNGGVRTMNASVRYSTPNTATNAGNAGSGAVNVISDPGGAEVEIDGAYYGNTPGLIQMTPGLHTITIRATGYAPWKRTLNIAAGSNLTVKADMQEVGQTAAVIR